MRNEKPVQPTARQMPSGAEHRLPMRRVTLDGEPVELTATEYTVLYELAIHAPRTVTHAILLQQVWGPGEPTRHGWCGTW